MVQRGTSVRTIDRGSHRKVMVHGNTTAGPATRPKVIGLRVGTAWRGVPTPTLPLFIMAQNLRQAALRARIVMVTMIKKVALRPRLANRTLSCYLSDFLLFLTGTRLAMRGALGQHATGMSVMVTAILEATHLNTTTMRSRNVARDKQAATSRCSIGTDSSTCLIQIIGRRCSLRSSQCSCFARFGI